MGRGEYPRHTGLAECHAARPALHRYHGQVGFNATCQHPLAVEQTGKLARREPVEIWHGILAHETLIALLDNGALDLLSAERVGAVEHHELLAVTGSCLHGQSHGGYERIAAATYVLDVIDQHVDIAQHLGGGFLGGAVQRVDLDAGLFVYVIGHVSSGYMVAPHAMLGGEQRGQLHPGGRGEYVDGRPHGVVYPSRVGDEADAFTLEGGEILCLKHLDAGSHRGFGPDLCGGRVLCCLCCGGRNLCGSMRAGREYETCQKGGDCHCSHSFITVQLPFLPNSGLILSRYVTPIVARQHTMVQMKKF